MAQSSVNKILRQESIKPWKFTSVQELLPDDPPKRLNFCNLVCDRQTQDIEFVNNICFSDEATFHLNGCVNKHNRFIYSKDNPHLFVEITSFSLLSPDFGIVYSLLDTTMNGERYNNILNTHVIPSLTQRKHRKKVFQQDSAPPHFSIQVRENLNESLKNRWIGRARPIAWPPRSPDLSVLDFWLGGQKRNNL